MRIVFFDTDKEEEKYLKEKLRGLKGEIKFYDKVFEKKDIKKIKDAEIFVGFIDSEIMGDVLGKLGKLKYIATMSTGYDHIDIKACKKNGIRVSNVPNYGENTVAEHAFGLIFTLARKLHKAIERTRKDDFSLEGLEGIDLKGKTLGVIGPGSIGQHVIQIGKGLEMNILVCGRHIDTKLEKKFGCKFVPLNGLLKKSDIISIHVPLTPKTKHMINMKNVKMIKKGAYLVNTARGEIVDTKALKWALDKGILAGAGLDVLEGEDYIKEEKELLKKKLTERELKTLKRNHLLLKKRNVVVTPHMAFYTKGALDRVLDTTAENVKGFIRGKVKNRVV
tara:strand:- start:846 stop:1850 length:1005 start_codon:yes stop_codon:yes gene_type:complete